MKSNINSILIIGPAWVGDMVMAQSLLMVLKQQQPDSQFDVLAPAWSFPLLERMPEVRQPIAMPITHGQLALNHRHKLGKQLRAKQYRQAIVLPNSWKSALIPFFAHIPLRTGYLGEARWGLLNDARTLDKQRLTMTVQRFVALAYDKNSPQSANYPVPKLSINDQQKAQVAAKFALTSQPLLAICPGAEYGPAKRWPSQYFAQVAKQLYSQGWQIVLLGSDKDSLITAEINYLSGNTCMDTAGKTSLGEAVDLLASADLVLSNDSGLMHIAAALQKRLLVIYGSSDPGFTPPLAERATILSLNLNCAPCFKRICPLGHSHCLTEIKPEMVLTAINEKLSLS